MRKHVAMSSLYYLVRKIWKTIVLYVISREKTPGLCYFLSAKNEHNIVMRFVIKYSYIFFQRVR